MVLGAVKVMAKYVFGDMLCPSGRSNAYLIGDHSEGVSDVVFRVGFYNNQNDVWEKFGD